MTYEEIKEQASNFLLEKQMLMAMLTKEDPTDEDYVQACQFCDKLADETIDLVKKADGQLASIVVMVSITSNIFDFSLECRDAEYTDELAKRLLAVAAPHLSKAGDNENAMTLLMHLAGQRIASVNNLMQEDMDFDHVAYDGARRLALYAYEAVKRLNPSNPKLLQLNDYLNAAFAQDDSKAWMVMSLQEAVNRVS